jgi:hypothetical protein
LHVVASYVLSVGSLDKRNCEIRTLEKARRVIWELVSRIHVPFDHGDWENIRERGECAWETQECEHNGE